MAKIVLNDLTNLQNEQTAVGTVNQNNQAIEIAMENTLSRDGTAPNEMEANLDMNNNRILNLPEPLLPTEPARREDIEELLDLAGDLQEAVDQAEQSAEDAEISNQSALSAQQAAEQASQDAAQSAQEAADQAEKLRSTSTTENTIGLGALVFTVDEDDYFSTNMYVFIVDNANDDNFMFGVVTDYTDDQLTVDVDVIGGSGTISDWTITISGVRGAEGAEGPQGPQGPAGEVGGPASSVVGNVVVFDNTIGSEIEDSGIAATNLLVDSDIGTAVQAYSANLDSWAAEVPSDYVETSDIGVTVQGYDAATLKGDVENQGPLTGGAEVTIKDLGNTTGGGTFTVDVGDRAVQLISNTAAFTLASSGSGATELIISNSATAGAITLSGFDVTKGDAYVTTNGAIFSVVIKRYGSGRNWVFFERMA